MDVREKLVELIESARYWGSNTSEEIADHLISNGVTVQENVKMSDELLKQLKNAPITICKEEPSIVTVQEWIPVTNSPKGKGCYIVAVHHWLDGKPVTREAYWNGCDWLSCDKKQELTPRVTHWMPMPVPPKGE